MLEVVDVSERINSEGFTVSKLFYYKCKNAQIHLNNGEIIPVDDDYDKIEIDDYFLFIYKEGTTFSSCRVIRCEDVRSVTTVFPKEGGKLNV